MAKIEIEWLHDTCECDTCGVTFADGARVKIDGKEMFDLLPAASCFGGQNFNTDEVYAKILEYYGRTVEQEYGGHINPESDPYA